MAETKKRGFHFLEERIHQIEEEDAKKEKSAAPQQNEAPRSAPAQGEREQPRKK